MGCFYSKVGSPPTAFTRDLSLSLKKRIADFPPFEDLLSTRAARAEHHHLFSLFYSIKLKSQELEHDDPPSPPDPEITTPETINTWELMADLEDSDQQEQQEKDPGPHEEGIDHQSPSDPADSDAFDPSPKTHIDGSPRFDLSESEQRSKDCTCALEPPAVDKIEERPPSDLAEFDPPEASGTGHRRKAAAMRLKLKIPSFDFNGAGELRRPNGEGEQVEMYETPKFGSYGRRGEGEEHGDVFDPELVAEIEEALERLTEEEEDVLRRIVEECMVEVRG